MISLLLTLFISMFSIGSSINKVDKPIENEITINTKLSPKGSVTYTDSNHTGYVTNYYEMCNDNAYENHLLSMLNIWSGYNESSGSVINNYTQLNMSGLYVQIPYYYVNVNSYDDMYNYVTSNYSGLEVVRVTLFNSIYSSWSTDSSINQSLYYLYQGDLYLRNGNILSYAYRANEYGNFSITYIYKNVNAVPIETNPIDKCFFATDNCTLGNAFLSKTGNSLIDNADQYYKDGYNAGYGTGYNTGVTAGESTGYGNGYQEGYNEGLAHADYDNTALTIFSGIMGIALVPINMFLNIFNFEILGINLAGLISGILTVAVVVIIIRVIVGGKNND